jgi:hypothetical protein
MPSIFARIALLFVLATASQASAAFIILDNFASPAVVQTAIIGPQASPAILSSLTGLGSTRTSTFAVTSSPVNPFDLLVQEGAGRLDFNSANFTRTSANLNYSNFTGGTNNFFSGGSPFRLLLDFTNLDPGQVVGGLGGPALNMPVDIAITTANGTLSGTFLLGSTSIPQTYALPFSSFTGNIQDLSNVLSVNIAFNSGSNENQRQAVDFVLTGVRVDLSAAPLPPTAFLALAGIPLLRLVRRRA